MRKHVDVQTASQMFSLDLPELGPYTLDYTRNGRHMVLGGQRGHVAVVDNLRMEVVQELHLRESVRDVQVRACGWVVMICGLDGNGIGKYPYLKLLYIT